MLRSIRYRLHRYKYVLLIVLIVLLNVIVHLFPSNPPYGNEEVELNSNKFEPDRNSLIVVTACNENHFIYLNYMLYSLKQFNVWVIFYDLGLNSNEKRKILSWSRLAYRQFDYGKYPSHFDIRVKSGEYAWKPVIISEVMNEFEMDIIWIDSAGYFLQGSIDTIKQRVIQRNVYIGSSPGTMRDYTHRDMFKALNATFEEYATKENFEAGFIAFHYSSFVMNSIVEPWKRCALIRECIAPQGSSRRNHRQDQSVLTYLLHKNQISLSIDRNLASDHVFIKCDNIFYSIFYFFGRYPNLQLFQRFCI